MRAELDPGRPPRLAEWLLRASAPAAERECMLGDLEEEHAQRARRGGTRVAGRWYWAQVLASLPINLWRRQRHAARLVRSTSRSTNLTQILQDLRYSLREAVRRPAFSLLVVGTLALGIAANTAIFSMVDSVLFNPFPFPEPARLVGVGPELPKLGRELSFWEVLSPLEIEDLREQSRTLEDIVAWDMGNRTLAGEEAPENVFSAFWWGNALPTLGVEPAHGRGFLPGETESGEKVAIISHRLFQRRFGGDSEIVGDTLLVNGDPYVVVGVLPPRTLIYGTDLWIPMGVAPGVFPRDRRQFQFLARIAEGYSLRDVNTELETIAGRIAAEWSDEYEEYEGWRLEAMTWNRINVRLLRPMAMVLVGAVAFVLLLVCANVANLLLGRSAARRQEIAVRQALGAGRGRIVRQLLTESVTLAVLGGVLGVALASLAVKGLSSLATRMALPLPADIEINGRVLAISAAVSLASGLLFGLAPALQASQRAIGGGLRLGQSRAVGRPRQRIQQVLVGVQVALAVVLLFGGGLLLHSLIQLNRVDPGYKTEDLLTFRITLPWERFDQPAITDFFGRLTEQLEARPEIRSAAATSQLPSALFSARQIVIEGQAPPTSEGSLPVAFVTAVSPNFFQTFDMALLRGRTFADSDDAGAPIVTVLNRVAAERLFPGEDPVGRRIKVGAGDERPWIEIVGVVAAGHNAGNDREPAAEVFGSVRQGLGANQLFVAVESSVAPAALVETVRDEVRALDPQIAIYAVQTMEDLIASDVLPRHMAVQLLLVLGAFALALAGVGVYAVVSFAVAQRTREIGLRMALGAGRARVRRWVVGRALRPVLVGGICGLLGAAGVAKALESQLFEVSAFDPATLIGAVALLVAIALGATLPPALRASGLDPAVTLREG